MVTIKELQKSIAEEKKLLVNAQAKQGLISEKDKLRRELFLLRNRKAIASAGKFGRFIKSTAKKATPIIKKQVKLIRQQQLRDDAIARKQATLRKKTKKKKPIKKQEFSLFSNLDF